MTHPRAPILNAVIVPFLTLGQCESGSAFEMTAPSHTGEKPRQDAASGSSIGDGSTINLLEMITVRRPRLSANFRQRVRQIRCRIRIFVSKSLRKRQGPPTLTRNCSRGCQKRCCARNQDLIQPEHVAAAASCSDRGGEERTAAYTARDDRADGGSDFGTGGAGR